MKQLTLFKGAIRVDDVPEPVITGNGIVLRTAYSVISSGTEIAALLRSREGRVARLKRMLPEDGILAYVRRKLRSGTLIKSSQSVAATLRKESGSPGEGMPLGYSSSGIVTAVDPRIAEVAAGDAVACGGTRHAGANYVPRNLFAPVPAGVDLREAAFATLGCIAMQGVRRAAIQPGDYVVVIGQGIIGQLTARLVRSCGAYPIVTDLNAWRLTIAAAAGAYETINAGSVNAVRRVHGITAGKGADSVLICASSASPQPLRDAIAMARDKGKLVLVGDVKIAFPRALFYEKELDFLISRSYGPGRYDPVYEEQGLDYPYDLVPWSEQRNMAEFIRLLAAQKLSVKDLISCEYDVTDAARAYERMAEKPESTMAVILRYAKQSPTEKEGSRLMITQTAGAARTGTIRTAVIGCGNFAAKYHLPTLHAIKAFDVAAVVDAVGAKAKQTAARYGARYCTSDYHEVVKDPEIDLAVITTRHNLHVPIAIDALTAGKHVLVEKPMAMNEQELRSLLEVIARSPKTFMIGFNRRFSPLSREAKQLIAGRSSPVVMHYRVANTFAPATSWVHDPREGGGTIVGECCHFFDLLHWFIGQEPVRIFAEGGTISHPGADIYDNTVISVKFRDGSVGTITFTDLGSEGFPKERIELFAGDRTIVIDDFKKLTAYGDVQRETILKTGAKGHYEEFEALAAAIMNKTESPVSYLDGTRAMECCFKTLESLKTGMPQAIDLGRYFAVQGGAGKA